MAKKSILEIPDGYKIEEKSYIVDRETACRILTSDKQRKFTYAKKLGEKVELTQHIIICLSADTECPPIRDIQTVG